MSESIQELRKIIARLETLESEMEDIRAFKKEELAKAKSLGFDTKIITKLISIRKSGRENFEEFVSLIEAYLDSLEGKDESHR